MRLSELPRPPAGSSSDLRRPIVVAAVALGLVVGCIASLLPAVTGFSVATASAQGVTGPTPDQLADEGLVTIDDVNTGVLLFETDTPGWFVTAPTLKTDIDVAVSGPIVRAAVTQSFRNPADVFVEGTYVFPLPEGATVDTLRMRVGDRWIEGNIAEKAEAREIFEAAREAGQVASLVEQLRPNMFTTSVANIAPGADVVVQIEYQETLMPRDGRFGLRLPLVVAPRYSTSGQQVSELTAAGWSTVNDPSVHRGAVSSRDDAFDREDEIRNPVDISVALNAGFPLGEIASEHHVVTTTFADDSSSQITLDGPVPANRDFLLSWKPDSFDEPYVATFSEQRSDETHHLAVLTAPTTQTNEGEGPAREVIFVQDTSGSMFGDSMDQARAGLLLALDRLDENDTFNIIEFNYDWTRFASAPVPATKRNLGDAADWIRTLRAEGGTEMLPALQAALNTDRQSVDEDRLRQVIFLTDGAVSDEQSMLRLIETDLNDTRLFTVGIGAAPNSYFMSAAARSGRGSFVYINNIDAVELQLQSLFAKIENPAIVGLRTQELPQNVEISPSPIPDLYLGDPVMVTVRVPAGSDVAVDELVLTGSSGSETVTLNVPLLSGEEPAVGSGPRAGVARLWAREHIRDLEAERLSQGLSTPDLETIDSQILETALEYGIVSRLTSLVAVDVEITRPSDETATTTSITPNLPDGWDPAAFAPTSDGAVDLSSQARARLEAAASDKQIDGGSGGPVSLPATATNWQLQALLGASLIVGGGTYLAGTRRRHNA